MSCFNYRNGITLNVTVIGNTATEFQLVRSIILAGASQLILKILHLKEDHLRKFIVSNMKQTGLAVESKTEILKDVAVH